MKTLSLEQMENYRGGECGGGWVLLGAIGMVASVGSCGVATAIAGIGLSKAYYDYLKCMSALMEGA